MTSFTSVNPAQTAQQNMQPAMPLEEQTLLMEAQRQMTANQVASGRLPPLPPTAMTPAGSPGSITPVPTGNQDPGQTGQRTMFQRPGLPPLPGGR